MILQQLEHQRVLLLGFGVEGRASYEFLRARFPGKIIGIADRQRLADLEIAPPTLLRLKDDQKLEVHCGENYLDSLRDYEMIVKTPGIASTAKQVEVYKAQRFSDHAPLIVDYDFRL